MFKTVIVPGDQIHVLADIGPGKVISATLLIEENSSGSPPDPNDLTEDEWEKAFDELLALSPINPYPVDDSREAIYGPDPDEAGSS